jgi:hypothetical protein
VRRPKGPPVTNNDVGAALALHARREELLQSGAVGRSRAKR